MVSGGGLTKVLCEGGDFGMWGQPFWRGGY